MAMMASFNLACLGASVLKDLNDTLESPVLFVFSAGTSTLLLLLCWVFLMVCGISTYARRVCATAGLIAKATLVITDVINNTKSDPLVHSRGGVLLDVLVAGLVASEALRFLEVRYGPKAYSDLHRRSLRAVLIRRFRQTYEFMAFTVLCGCVLRLAVSNTTSLQSAIAVSNHICATKSTFCESLGRLIHWTTIAELSVATLCSGVLQKVFGVNPSYKSDIQAQYGEILQKKKTDSDTSGASTSKQFDKMLEKLESNVFSSPEKSISGLRDTGSLGERTRSTKATATGSKARRTSTGRRSSFGSSQQRCIYNPIGSMPEDDRLPSSAAKKLTSNSGSTEEGPVVKVPKKLPAIQALDDKPVDMFEGHHLLPEDKRPTLRSRVVHTPPRITRAQAQTQAQAAASAYNGSPAR